MTVSEHELASGGLSLTPQMQEFLADFRLDPTRAVECVFGDGPAIIIRDMNLGCIALKNTVVQPLCQQHDTRRTPMEGDVAVVDLSVGAAWSKHQNIEPLFIVGQEGVLTEFAQRPILSVQK